ALRACHAPRPVAWWRRVGVGSLQALGLAAASLLIQWAAPVPPGSWKFLPLVPLPGRGALAWKGFWAGGWAAAAGGVGGLLLSSPWSAWGTGGATLLIILALAWGSAGVAMLIFFAAAGHAAGYVPPRGRVRLGWQEGAVGPGGTALWHNGGT